MRSATSHGGHEEQGRRPAADAQGEEHAGQHAPVPAGRHRAGQPQGQGPREVAERGGRQPEPGAGGQDQRGEGGPPAAVDDEELAQAPQRQQGEGHPDEVDQHGPADAVEHRGGQLLDGRAGTARQLVVPVVEPRAARSQHVGHVDVGAVPQEREGHVPDEHRDQGPAQRARRAGRRARTGPAGSAATVSAADRSPATQRGVGHRHPHAPRLLGQHVHPIEGEVDPVVGQHRHAGGRGDPAAARWPRSRAARRGGPAVDRAARRGGRR